uniref:hypothetical protein n=1 Tax=Alloprevotella sp. TaxID=1872471 RepID=UPI003FEF8FB1
MIENKNLVAALTRRLGEKEKEYVELEERYTALSDACESLEKQLDIKYKLSKIGECIAKNEHPILITGVKIGDADFCVLSQGMVYSLFYGTREMLYFAPKAYYPAERLLECYFVIGAKGDHYTQAFIPEWIHGCQYYNSMPHPFPDFAQQRDCMLALDYDNMRILWFHREDEIERIKALAKQINPKFMFLDAIIPGMISSKSLRLVIPDFEHLKNNAHY